MRIALVSQEYPPQTAHGGIATQTRAKAHGLAALGHAVHVVSHSVDERRHEYTEGAVQVVRIPGFDAQRPLASEAARWLTYSALVAAEVAALHQRVGLDLVDFPEWGGEGFIHLLDRAPGDLPRVVLHLHGPLAMLAETIGWPERDSPLYRVGTLMERTCLESADAVMSSSRCSAEWCARAYGHRRFVPVLHAGIDTALFSPQPAARAEAPTLLFVGRVAPSKGVRTLVAAYGRLAAQWPALRLRLVGRVEPAFRAELVEAARRLGCGEGIDIAGFVPREALPAEYRAAQVFVAPSRYEGGPGFVYLEAMACGTPVIGCAGSGAAEAIVDGTGLLVPPDDAGALARAIARLLDDEALRARMGARAREVTVAMADSRDCIARLADFYAGVVEGRR